MIISAIIKKYICNIAKEMSKTLLKYSWHGKSHSIWKENYKTKEKQNSIFVRKDVKMKEKCLQGFPDALKC